ncbi:MAG: hypothetical protein IT427_18170 [Pirellulales bacterium]|nr:hypothetical protein [Pirellulales bacterium]
MMKFLAILFLLLAGKIVLADDAATLQRRIDSQSSFTIPAGRHVLDRPLYVRSGKKLFAHKDAVLVVEKGGNYPAIYVLHAQNVELNLPRIEHGGAETGNSTIICIFHSENVTLHGGQLIGGFTAIFGSASKNILINGTETRQSLTSYGNEFQDCENISLIDFKAIGHRCDGVRFLKNNRGVLIRGGEYRSNGSRFPAGGVIGVGIHLGQSQNVVLEGRPIVAGNLGNGVCWKASYPPGEFGTMKNLTIDGLVLDGNGANQLEVRWNWDTPGTVRPRGFSARNVVARNGRENGMYLDCDGIDVAECCFVDCDRLIVGADNVVRQAAAGIGIVYSRNKPNWQPTNTDFVRCPNSVVFYRVDR